MFYGYAMYQADRMPTPAEQRETDTQIGRVAAAIRRLSSPPARRAGRRPCPPIAGVSSGSRSGHRRELRA
jgi:hypothetical protein